MCITCAYTPRLSPLFVMVSLISMVEHKNKLTGACVRARSPFTYAGFYDRLWVVDGT